MTNRNNPPAFPASWTNDGDRNATAPDGQVVPPAWTHHMTGMTLRDYFAGQVMAGLATSKGEANGMTFAEFAQAAYMAADAMLEERAKKS
jgi:hypothetical protein